MPSARLPDPKQYWLIFPVIPIPWLSPTADYWPLLSTVSPSIGCDTRKTYHFAKVAATLTKAAGYWLESDGIEGDRQGHQIQQNAVTATDSIPV
jgi:hypothetical protein